MQFSLFGDFVALDLETTGLTPDDNKIIEVGAVQFAGHEVWDMTVADCGLNRLVNPDVTLDAKITEITGITQDMLDGQPDWETVKMEVQAFLNPPVRYLVAHNAAFEHGFLTAYGLDLDHLLWLDTLEMVPLVMPEAPGASLGVAAAIMQVAPATPHRAGHDALATGQLFMALWQRMREMPDTAIRQILAHAPANWPYQTLFQTIAEERDLSPPATSIPFACAPGGGDRAASHVPEAGAEDSPHTLSEWLESALQPGQGTVASLPCDAASSHALAGACVQWTVQDRRRLLLCLAHDRGGAYPRRMWQSLQRAAQALAPGPQITWQENPGRLCDLSRLNAWKANRRLDQKETAFLTQILYGVTASTPDHWPPHWLDPRAHSYDTDVHGFWSLVAGTMASAPSDLRPTGHSLPIVAPEAAAGSITVMDHDTLLLHLATDPDFAQHFDALVVDDIWNLWHRIPPVGTQTHTLGALTYLVQKVGDLVSRLAPVHGPPGDAPCAGDDDPVALLAAQVENVVGRLQEFRKVLQRTAQEILDRESEAQSWQLSRVSRDMDQMKTDLWRPFWRNLSEQGQQLASLMKALSRATPPDYGPQIQGWRQELQAVLNHLNEVLRHAAHPSDPETVRWLTLRTKADRIEFHISQLWTEAYVQRTFPQVLMLYRGRQRSAPEGFLATQLGLGSFRHLPSPISWKRKSALQVVVPQDMPDPKSEIYDRRVKELLPDIIRQVQTCSLILFARSFELRRMAPELRQSLANPETRVLIQGWDPWTDLADGLQHRGRSVLCGTFEILQQLALDNVPLECVVVTRLPFPARADPAQSRQFHLSRPPTDPGDEFQGLVLPQVGYTLLRIIDQLITPTSPQGRLWVLDPRIRQRYMERVTRPWTQATWHFPDLDEIANAQWMP